MSLVSEVRAMEKLLGEYGDDGSCICQPPSTLMIWQYAEEVAQAFFNEAEVGNVVFDDSPAADWRKQE